MIVYFTGTGNSRYCAKMLADRLDDEAIDAFHFIRDGIAAELASDNPWVFVSPTYAWQLPRVFANFIRSGSFAGSKDAYFVMTCGSETGNAAPKNRALCKEKDFLYKGTLGVVMPENYIAMFSAPGQEEALRIIESARSAIEGGAVCIRQSRDFPARRTGIADRLKSGVVNAVFCRFLVKAKNFTVSEDCTDCGKCERSCPLHNIRLKNNRPVWGDRCTHCMACICGCPAAAVEYGKASCGKPRYQCPDYK